MEYSVIIDYVLEHSVEIKFLEKFLSRSFFFLFFGFMFYIFLNYFFKIGNQKKKFALRVGTNILPLLLLSICIIQSINMECDKWKFYELEYEIKIIDKKIKDIKKEIKDFM